MLKLIKKYTPRPLKEIYLKIFYKYKKFKINLLSNLININQTSKGKIPLLSPTVEKSHKIWKSLPDNKIESYAKADISRTKYLFKLIHETGIHQNGKILEIGTNVGRNLNYLFEHSYTNLNGIEINKNAVDAMKKYFPNLRVKMLVGSAEKTLKNIETNSMDLTFSMAVLMHINPHSHFIFKEIARITKYHLITIEIEDLYNPESIFPRDYNKVFSEYGFEQIYVEKLAKSLFGVNQDYVARVFKKKIT